MKGFLNLKKEFCLIQDVFAEPKFKLFKNYSIEHQLIYLQDISPEILENFAKQAGSWSSQNDSTNRATSRPSVNIATRCIYYRIKG